MDSYNGSKSLYATHWIIKYTHNTMRNNKWYMQQIYNSWKEVGLELE